MGTKKRIKLMPRDQFDEVMRREWSPVKLEHDSIPSWLRGIPQDLLHAVYASGTASVGIPLIDHAVPSGVLMGGIDVYRTAPDDPYELNKDWYAVIAIPDSDGMLLIQGPISDSEHWLNEIPERLQGAEVLGVPSPGRPRRPAGPT
jgi:hypothetical protein